MTHQEKQKEIDAYANKMSFPPTGTEIEMFSKLIAERDALDQSPQSNCEHEFTHLRSSKKFLQKDGRFTIYQVSDIFHCIFCLEYAHVDTHKLKVDGAQQEEVIE